MKRLVIFFLPMLLIGCSKLDDYMLGTDNSPQPKELGSINSSIAIEKKWSVGIGKSHKGNGYLKLKPIIKGSLIYLSDANGLVSAVNTNTGKIKWSKHLSHSLVSGPTVGKGTLAFGTANSSLIILSELNGDVLWEANLSGELISAPTISGQKIVAKTINGRVYVFDLSTGKKLWEVDHGSPSLVLKASSSPVIDGNLALIGFSDGKFDAFELDSGRLVWQRSLSYSTGASDVERLVDIDADPIIQGNTVYLGSYQGYVGALSLASGEFIWRRPASIYKNMALYGHNLYFTDSKDVLWSLNAATGQVNWKQTKLKARGLTEPVELKNNLVVGDKLGFLHFIDIQTGELIGRTQLSSAVEAAPIVRGYTLYVVTSNGLLEKLKIGQL